MTGLIIALLLTADGGSERAIDAYQRKDFVAFLKLGRAELANLPDDPRRLYNVACAESLAGSTAASARLINGLLDRGVDFGVEGDPDLARLRASGDYQRVQKRLHALRAPIGRPTVVFTLADPTLLTEGIAYDPATARYFVSSVHQRKVVVRELDGGVHDFSATAQDGMLGVLALEVDAPRNLLWAAVSAVPQMETYERTDSDRSGLAAFDLKTGETKMMVLLPRAGTLHTFGDLLLTPSGDLYASDASGGIWVLRTGQHQLELFLPGTAIRSPQGMVLSRDRKHLLVASYTDGLFSVDLMSREVTALLPPGNTVLLGIDGMKRVGEVLVATQNMFAPARVIRLTLDEAEKKIVAVDTLVANHSAHDEPTLGTAVGNSFVYIANAQWNAFGPNPTKKPVSPVVLRIDLPSR